MNHPDPSADEPDADSRELTFEEALQNLEMVVQRLEEGRLSLSDSLAAYEQGVKRLRHCYRLLERAEGRIEQLVRLDADGNAVLEPFGDDGQGDDLAEKQRARAKRRSSSAAESSADKPAKTPPTASPSSSIRRKRRPRSDVDESGGLF